MVHWVLGNVLDYLLSWQFVWRSQSSTFFVDMSGVSRARGLGAAEMNGETDILMCYESNTCIFPVEHGWNDPPVFTYSSLQTGAAKKTQLTKRVKHDLTTHPPQTPAPHKHPEAITDFPSGPPIISVPSEEPKQTQENSELVTETSTRSTLKKPEDTSAEVVTLESVQQCLERIMADYKDSMPVRLPI